MNVYIDALSPKSEDITNKMHVLELYQQKEDIPYSAKLLKINTQKDLFTFNRMISGIKRIKYNEYLCW